MADTATKERPTPKDHTEKLARQRLSALELAQSRGNPSAACRRAGMGGASFYVRKRRFQTHGLAGLHGFSTATTPIRKRLRRTSWSASLPSHSGARPGAQQD